MNRQALLGALAVAVLAFVLNLLYLRRFEAEKSGGDPVRVLVLVKAVPAGKPITADLLSVRAIPMAYVDARAVKASERDTVVGLPTVVSLDAQTVLAWTDLAAAAEPHRDLSALVTPGFRAVYIRAIREDQGAPLVSPGDYVDVIATLPQGNERSIAVVLLQRVLVLANGNRTTPDAPAAAHDPHAPPPRDQGLTLSLSLEDAEVIALAAERGHFSVALRNPDDQRTTEGMPQIGDSALLGHSLASNGGPSARATVPVKLHDGPVGGPAR